MALTMIIPLDSSPNQSFQITLPFETYNRPVDCELRYNEIIGYWLLSIFDPSLGKPLLCNIPLVPGTDLLGQYQYLNLGHLVIANVGETTFKEWPSKTNLGTLWKLVWRGYE